MADLTEELTILRVTEPGSNEITDTIIMEVPLTIVVNDKELVTLLCSPVDLKYLVLGFLQSEGLIKGKDEIQKIIVNESSGVAMVETKESQDFDSRLLFKRLITSGCGRGASFYSAADVQGQARVESQTRIAARQVLLLASEFQHRSETYRETGGVHGAALCDADGILIFKEDIGRHNAIDKVFGECLWRDIPTGDRIVISSGRISSEVLLKAARRNIPILISKSAPTSLAVRLATDLNITLIGFVRGKRMNVYTCGWRVVTGE